MPGRWRTTGSLQAGYVLGIIGTVLLVIGVSVGVVFLVLAFNRH